MPNLENLKKQAKQYLRWHRDGYHPVAAEIRAALPRFRHFDDSEVMQAAFKLADAQELVARQQGFESWQALKAGAPEMNDQTRQMTRPVLSSTAAQLFVADVKASCDFFVDKLGFAIDFVYGEPLFYGQVVRDRAQLALRLVCEPVMSATSASASICCRRQSLSIPPSRSSSCSSISRRQACPFTRRCARNPGVPGPSSCSIQTAI